MFSLIDSVDFCEYMFILTFQTSWNSSTEDCSGDDEVGNTIVSEYYYRSGSV